MWPKCEHCGKNQMFELAGPNDENVVCKHCKTFYRKHGYDIHGVKWSDKRGQYVDQRMGEVIV